MAANKTYDFTVAGQRALKNQHTQTTVLLKVLLGLLFVANASAQTADNKSLNEVNKERTGVSSGAANAFDKLHTGDVLE